MNRKAGDLTTTQMRTMKNISNAEPASRIQLKYPDIRTLRYRRKTQFHTSVESVTAGIASNPFRRDTRVFTAIQRPYRVYLALLESFIVRIQERTDIGKFAALAAMAAGTLAKLRYRQNRGNGPFDFSGECIMGKHTIFFIKHIVKNDNIFP